MAKDLGKTNSQTEEMDNEPIVYAVQKDLTGWKFSRRDFLKGAVTTAEVAVVAGAVSGCGGSNVPEATATLVPTEMPTSTNTPDPTPRVIMKYFGVNLRSGPGAPNYPEIKELAIDEVLEVIARNGDGSWFRVKTETGDIGWVSAAVVTFDFSIENIPIETNIPTPPPSTATPSTPPGKQGTVAPGKRGINYTIGGKTYTLPCGSSLPDGAVCVCNCVTAPRACACVGHCSCDSQGSHYWYPN